LIETIASQRRMVFMMLLDRSVGPDVYSDYPALGIGVSIHPLEAAGVTLARRGDAFTSAI
jgi:hypothetical protein